MEQERGQNKKMAGWSEVEALGRRNAAHDIEVFDAELPDAPPEMLINAVNMNIANAVRIYGPSVGDEGLEHWREAYMAEMMPWLAGKMQSRN